ncbi:conserved hypothetical protein [Histoplasma capsulatum var. duboisii H88]|uniref:Uncharacterized protein n=1 Tax=Ajellomyces capsulatus (strain H88) TaxID=544711 RepID=F0U8J9_AJEC8|nr:conserved hypothetical protein [Histoplasma capsulatum var. duboisii H88]
MDDLPAHRERGEYFNFSGNNKLPTNWVKKQPLQIQVENTSFTSTAIETYQLDVESTALIRAAEDILSLTRSMKEAWLFGKLDTLGENERDVQRREALERDALTVKNAIENGVVTTMK